MRATVFTNRILGVVIPANAGILCNNESPRPAPACRKAGATRYLTGYRDKPGMTTKVDVVIPANAGILCNNESPRPAPACRKAGATRYLTGYRDKPGMTTKVDVVIPANAR